MRSTLEEKSSIFKISADGNASFDINTGFNGFPGGKQKLYQNTMSLLTV